MEYLRDFAEHLVLFPGWEEERMATALDEVARRLKEHAPRSMTAESRALFRESVEGLLTYLTTRDTELLARATKAAEEAHDLLMAARDELARLSPLGYRDW